MTEGEVSLLCWNCRLDYGYPHTGQMYGQSFFCVTFEADSQADEIGRQLMYNKPYIYASNVPDFAWKRLPTLAKVAAGSTRKEQEPFFSLANLKSFSNTRLLSFAKYTDFNKDLYSGKKLPLSDLSESALRP